MTTTNSSQLTPFNFSFFPQWRPSVIGLGSTPGARLSHLVSMLVRLTVEFSMSGITVTSCADGCGSVKFFRPLFWTRTSTMLFLLLDWHLMLICCHSKPSFYCIALFVLVNSFNLNIIFWVYSCSGNFDKFQNYESLYLKWHSVKSRHGLTILWLSCSCNCLPWECALMRR